MVKSLIQTKQTISITQHEEKNANALRTCHQEFWNYAFIKY